MIPMSNENKEEFTVEAFENVESCIDFCSTCEKYHSKPIIVLPYREGYLNPKLRDIDAEVLLTSEGEDLQRALMIKYVLAKQEGWKTLEPIPMTPEVHEDIIGFYMLKIVYGADVIVSHRPITLFSDAHKWIASFNLIGETLLNEQCANFLYKKLQNDGFLKGKHFDIIACAEAKAMAMVQLISRMYDETRHVVLRKSVKNYMPQHPVGPLIEEFESITTKGKQQLVLDPNDLPYVRGRKILLIDDVVATGGTIRAAIRLFEKAGGEVVRVETVLLKGKHPEVKNFGYLKKSVL